MVSIPYFHVQGKKSYSITCKSYSVLIFLTKKFLVVPKPSLVSPTVPILHKNYGGTNHHGSLVQHHLQFLPSTTRPKHNNHQHDHSFYPSHHSNKQEGKMINTNTVLSFFQWRPLLHPPDTVATAFGIDHPEAPPTKKRISATSPLQSTHSLLGTTPPDLTFTSKRLCINISMPVTDAKYSPKTSFSHSSAS